MKPTPTRKTLIQSIERAFDILDIVREQAPVRSAAIARALGLSPSAASNIVRTLFHRGYLMQNGDGLYVLGPQAYLLGVAADAWGPLRQAAELPMLRLNQSTGHLCFLGAEARGTVIAVRIVEGTGALVVPRNQKWLHQLHCTAAGKVLLASMAREYFAAIKEVYELTVQTQATVTSWEKLEQDLGVVRASGFCVCKDESVFGVVSLAVPVVGGDGTVVAALSVAFSSYFLTPELQDELIGKLRQASREISAGMV